ncbi:hypothetical protein [Sinorhizobium terangae]|uniref:hypothetical protein n=1 Tax=Sinorhizobium terangae TaxID=110322 RepID=UPI0024B23D68|nr:hypothetical protein [Sinorhizobium terangae]WFU50233.1 hypothetical protein QA637_25980 [Sinorhizobium terangae]
MAIADLILEVEALKRASRDIDVKIGLLVGWQRKVEYTRENGEASRNVIWFLHGERAARLPRFTETIDSALQLVDLVAPHSSGGVSWSVGPDGSYGTAVINDGPYCQAATPALALCLAALKIKEAESDD